MKLKKIIKILCIAQLIIFQISKPQTTTTHKQVKCKVTSKVPYIKQLTTSTLPTNLKQQMMKTWGHLYAAYLAKSASSTQTSKQWKDLKRKIFINNSFCKYTPLGQDPKAIEQLKFCLDKPTKTEHSDVVDCQQNVENAYNALNINYLDQLQTYLSPKTFPKIKNDKTGFQRNYATVHLNKAVSRLAQTCSIGHINFEPSTKFTGDIRDLGTIVNITNNTDTSFFVTQQNETETTIAQLNHGLNGVNLHTASLQDSSDKAKETPSINQFSFYPIAPDTQQPISQKPLFVIRMYNGTDLKKFLHTLPHDTKNNTFEMNGRPTSPQHLAEDNDWYMVLIQNPTPLGQKRNHDQRIQAINLSALKGHYLLNMTINETTITDTEITKHPKNTNTTKPSIEKIYQPAFTTVQVIQPPSPNMPSLPLIILPQFLWNMPTMQLYWMMYATTYISAATDFSLFGPDTFGSAFEYFKGLGYFETKYEYLYFIDRYSITKIGQALYDAPWLMSCIVYETDLKNCNDISQIHPTQNNQGNIIANGYEAFHINFQITFPPISPQQPNNALFNKNGFNLIYDMPYHQLYTFIMSLPTPKVKQSVFAQFTKQKNENFNITWSDKQDNILNSQKLSFSSVKKHNYGKFLKEAKNWQGSEIPIDLTKMKPNESKEFKVIYNKDQQKFSLEASHTSPIDRVRIILGMDISEYPLHNLHYDVFKTFKMEPYTRCYIFQNGILPKFLQSLTESDWKEGIYIVPSIKNNKSINTKNTGALTVTFYRSDKTLLGNITTKGTVLGTNIKGIQEPVTAYNIHSKQFKTFQEASLNAGFKIKYVPSN